MVEGKHRNGRRARIINVSTKDDENYMRIPPENNTGNMPTELGLHQILNLVQS